MPRCPVARSKLSLQVAPHEFRRDHPPPRYHLLLERHKTDFSVPERAAMAIVKNMVAAGGS
jgi:hypothetical protein